MHKYLQWTPVLFNSGLRQMTIQKYVTACEVNTVCEPLSWQPVKSCYQEPDYHNDLRIDILIGDPYYEFVSDTMKSGAIGEPTAVFTKLGWVLGGPCPDIKLSF